MALSPGTRLGAYEIVSLLGAGGMGEVYRAKDTKLHRDVAIKVLPGLFVNDPERLARFQREAQVLASLNHPNIGGIYGLEDADGIRALVMELVDGESLDKRIARGKIPVDDALAIAEQIVEALEAAHEKGIIHRDLKPANIVLTAAGNVKVLDFGLAKAMDPTGATLDLANSPTITSPAMMTGVGVILGTAAYMSPEQAKGRPADKRSDIWAFGCVLYEMLAGKRAFDGGDVGETLASILRDTPAWEALPAVPSTIRLLAGRCLERDPRQRISEFGTARFLLTEPVELSDERPRRSFVAVTTATVCGVVTAIILATAILWTFSGRRVEPQTVTRFSIPLPRDGSVFVGTNQHLAVAISPDGSRFVYAARIGSAAPQLYLRVIDQLDAVSIRGAEGGVNPFFSPDGKWVGYVTSSGGKLMKVPVGGGVPTIICDVAGGMRGATWLSDDTIVFAPPNSGLKRVPSAGGLPVDLTTVDPDAEVSHSWPEVLPGEDAILFTVTQKKTTGRSIAVLRIKPGIRTTVIEDGFTPHYVASGHLVFARGRDGVVMAVPFDLRNLTVHGDAIPAIDSVMMTLLSGMTQMAVSRTGSIIYISGHDTARSMVWVDRSGQVRPINAPARTFEFPRLSPDGRRVAVSIIDNRSTALRDVWLFEFEREALTRVTVEKNEAETPTWTSDGKYLTYVVDQSGIREIVRRRADGGGGAESLLTTEMHLHSGSWSPDGRLVGVIANGESAGSVWLATFTPKPTLQPLLETRWRFHAPTVSPDGHWIAFASDETNQFEVYVASFPNLDFKRQVSIRGGAEPRWATDGHELFYRDQDKMMAARVDTHNGTLQIGSPQMLFEGRFDTSFGTNRDAWYDVAPDGRFIMLRPADWSTHEIVVAQHWFEELKVRVPTK